MKAHSLFIMLVMIFFSVSCTKEVSREQDDDPVVDSPADTLSVQKEKFLKRLVYYEENSPGDSTVNTYTYDQNKKIVSITTESFGPGLKNTYYSNTEHIFYRDADGVVNRITIIDKYYEGELFLRIDSSVLQLVHDPVSKHYTSCIETINLVPIDPVQDNKISDSVMYTYDAKDHIVLYQRFRKDASTNIVFEAQRFENTYDVKGNIVKILFNENFDNDGYPLSEVVLEYDDKKNPFASFGNDAHLMGIYSIGIPSRNNAIKQFSNGVELGVMNYSYDMDDYPVKAEEIYDSPLGKATSYFYY
ncbi:MAG: hypothetical protein QM763_17725 [Agriterribacter sp.]